MVTVIACLLRERSLPSSVWIRKLSPGGQHLGGSAVSGHLAGTEGSASQKCGPCSAGNHRPQREVARQRHDQPLTQSTS